MRNNQSIAPLLLIAISAVLITICIKNYRPSVEEVEVKVVKGQVWVYESEDPFNPFINEFEILEVKNGYTKYKDIETGRTGSKSVYMLTAIYHLKAPSIGPVVIEIPGRRTQRLRTPRSIGPDVLITGGD